MSKNTANITFVSLDIYSYPIGVWIEGIKLEIVQNQKKGHNLIFGGYSYRREATFKSSSNWICSKSATNGCRGRLITRIDGCLKLGKNPHSCH